MTEQLAIIKDVGIGMRDVGRPVLWWTVYVGDNAGALHVFDWEEANAIITAYGVENVQDLNGKPCWVEVDSNKITFKRACKI